MYRWLNSALDYIPQWIEFQMRQSEQPGCVIAIAYKGQIVLEQAFGHADLSSGEPLTPRHRFRVASHSKSFTAAGIMKLREQGKLRLDDAVGRHVDGLHPAIAKATIAQLLSHSAGVVRDGADSGQWQDRRPFLDVAELRTALAEPPVIGGNTRFKYSNHGFGLAGMVIEAIAGEPYKGWIKREIVDAVGLAETEPDMPTAANLPMARGHSAKWPIGRRLVIPGDNPTNALAPATGFVSTAADLVQFFGQLDPAARHSVLSAASRREMTRRQWQDPHSSFDSWYGLGLASGRTADTDWFGHGGGFQGFITRTSVLPERGLALSILTNASDGWAHLWWGGIMQILSCFARQGAPSARVKDWNGRWWTPAGAIDLLPVGGRVLVAAPALLNPVMDASEITVSGADRGKIAVAHGFAHHGEAVRRKRANGGAIEEIWVGGTRFVPEAKAVAELTSRYGKRSRPRLATAQGKRA
jgi:CubicO group peptidase (beta-lactamase class C family)